MIKKQSKNKIKFKLNLSQNKMKQTGTAMLWSHKMDSKPKLRLTAVLFI